MKKNPLTAFTFLFTFGVFFTNTTAIEAAHHEEPVLEVRIYNILPGKMEAWERFFHDELVAHMEKTGMKVIGAYRSTEKVNQFVWIRKFSSKAGVEKARKAFYGSDLWNNVQKPKARELIDSVEKVYTVKPSH